jgi:hypothetical protein
MLARHHQLQQAYISATDRFESANVFGSGQVAIDMSIMTEVNSVLSCDGIQRHQMFSEVTIKGIRYCRGQVLLLEINHSSKQAIFGEIVAVVSDADQVKFVVTRIDARYEFDVGCYLLCNRMSVCVVCVNSVADIYPLNVYSKGDSAVIILKHQFCDAM